MMFINIISNSVLIFLHVFHFGLNTSLPWTVNISTVMIEEGQQAHKIKRSMSSSRPHHNARVSCVLLCPPLKGILCSSAVKAMR